MKNIFIIWLAILSQLCESDQTLIMQHYFQDLKISILGDSISTYHDYSNNEQTNSTIKENWVFYHSNETISNVTHTWWMPVILEAKMKLLVNNSYSSSEMGRDGYLRASQLHNDHTATNPDVIIIYMGINDLNNQDQAYLGKFNESIFNELYQNETYKTPTTFAQAYAISVHKAKTMSNDVFCCTLFENQRTYDLGKIDMIEEYNQIIKQIATYFDCEVIDFYNSNLTLETMHQYTIDGIHPNEAGMHELSQTFKESLNHYAIKKYQQHIENIIYHIIKKIAH